MEPSHSGSSIVSGTPLSLTSGLVDRQPMASKYGTWLIVPSNLAVSLWLGTASCRKCIAIVKNQLQIKL